LATLLAEVEGGGFAGQGNRSPALKKPDHLITSDIGDLIWKAQSRKLRLWLKFLTTQQLTTYIFMLFLSFITHKYIIYVKNGDHFLLLLGVSKKQIPINM
ncbi:hypothetical protein ACJX0J_039661, partial [Zea mays]